MTLLFDLSGVSDRTLNHHLDCLCKALSDPPEGKGDGSMWELHPSVFLRTLVEAFTALGLGKAEDLKKEAAEWLSGAMHAKHAAGGGAHPVHGSSGPVPNGPTGSTGGPTGGFPGSAGGSGAPGAFPLVLSRAWTPAELAEVRAYLLGKTLLTFTLADWLLMADYLVHSHFPPGFADSQAEWLAARAGLMAKVEEAMPDATLEQVDNVLAAMPNTIVAAGELVPLKPALRAAMEFGKARAAENIRNLTDELRHAMKSVILQSLEQSFQAASGGYVPSTPALQSKLFELFGELNRDWRRIAVTEAGEIKNQGFVALQPLGAFVKRVERYRGACTFCRNLDGRIFKVVDAGDVDKDGTHEVWPGKTNVGRSASPRKRVGGELIDRTAAELWWAAAGVQHPHCRGAWVSVAPPLKTSTDKQWKLWLSALGMPAPV